MRFSVNRDELLEALQKVQSVVEKKNSIQILANILCSVKDQQLSLCATDLEVGVKVTIPVDSEQDGRITLSAKHFLDIVKELPSKPLKISRKENNWVELTCGRSRFNVVSLSADEYPALPPFEEKEYFESSVQALSTMINKTVFAVSTDATRYHLNGVFLENLENNVMRMVACDGHRLSYVDSEIFKKMPSFKRGLIIPKKGVGELKKLLEEASEEIGLAFDRGYIFAKNDNTYLFVRLIEGEYPDYRQVIPKETKNSVLLNREEFVSVLRRVSLLAHEKSRGVKLVLTGNKAGKGTLVLTSSNPDMGEAREEMEINYSGPNTEIAYNAKYVLDSLAVMAGEVEFRFSDRLSPGILQGKDQRNHTYIIMPMRI